MTSLASETPPAATARAAGLLYLVIIVCGLFSELYVRGGLIVPGNAAATAANILASEGLFRLGFASDSLVFLSDAALAALLYLLFRPVSRTLALVAAALRLAQAAVLGLNLLLHHVPLLLLGGADYLAAFSAEQLQALALLALEAHSHGYDLGLLFFGLHCLVLGTLMVRAPWAPGILGLLIIAAGLAYLVGSFTLFLAPAHADTAAPVYLVALVAELSLCLWLLTRGARLRA